MDLDFSLPPSRLHALRSGAVLVPDAPALIRVEGTGALTCLQGLLTNDLVAPGDGSLVYGAMLTPRGMIVFDAWVVREEDALTVVIDGSARAVALELFRRTLPPRLARVTDLTDTHRTAWLLGAAAPERLTRAVDSPVPTPARVLRAGSDRGVLVAGGTAAAPFTALVIGPADQCGRIAQQFDGGRAMIGGEEDLAAAKILAGWPALGREVDEKTLPQEVRFDEIGGVSYTKGCYTGQETVARIHFRGHVNRALRGLTVEGPEPLPGRTLMLAGKDVGQARSALSLEDRVLALGMIRREVETGGVVTVSGRAATVVPLPFEVS
jgi:folate-binding protein YgfZ